MKWNNLLLKKFDWNVVFNLFLIDIFEVLPPFFSVLKGHWRKYTRTTATFVSPISELFGLDLTIMSTIRLKTTFQWKFIFEIFFIIILGRPVRSEGDGTNTLGAQSGEALFTRYVWKAGKAYIKILHTIHYFGLMGSYKEITNRIFP